MTKIGDNIVKPLQSVIERIEKLEEEKADIAAAIRDIFAEAKGNGLSTKIIRQVLRLRKMDQTEREEQEYLRDVYLKALGLIADDEE